MTETNNFSADEWLETQRKMWDQWTNLTSQTLQNLNKPSAAPTSPWETLNPMGMLAGQNMPPEINDICQKMVDASKPYFDMAEQVTKLSEEGLNLHQIASNWADKVTNTFNQMAEGQEKNDTLRDIMAFWDLPQDTWQRTFSSLCPMPGDVFRALRPEGLTRAPGDIHGRLDQFLSSPALGYTRESQEKYQKLHRVMLHYQKAMHDYNIAMSKVNLEAVELFQRKMHQLSETDTEITSVKELYVLWVDACEEVYAEYAMSDSYAALYGELVNSLMAVKRQTSRIIDEFLESMNMPTRKEVSTLHKRVQETRRDYNRLKEDSVEEMREELESLRAIKDEIKELRAEVVALKKGTGTSKGKQEK